MRAGCTPLLAAVRSGRELCARFLIEHVACLDFLNQPQHDGCTPLHMAVTTGNVALVRLLCEAGASPTRLGVWRNPRFRFFEPIAVVVRTASYNWRLASDLYKTLLEFGAPASLEMRVNMCARLHEASSVASYGDSGMLACRLAECESLALDAVRAGESPLHRDRSRDWFQLNALSCVASQPRLAWRMLFTHYWPKLRLLFIGHTDDGSLPASLPSEIIGEISRHVRALVAMCDLFSCKQRKKMRNRRRKDAWQRRQGREQNLQGATLT